MKAANASSRAAVVVPMTMRFSFRLIDRFSILSMTASASGFVNLHQIQEICAYFETRAIRYGLMNNNGDVIAFDRKRDHASDTDEVLRLSDREHGTATRRF